MSSQKNNSSKNFDSSLESLEPPPVFIAKDGAESSLPHPDEAMVNIRPGTPTTTTAMVTVTARIC
ncbi:MAG: hypothetical protein AAF385_08635, partial [Pseudomonadota bacterium]